jgi:hypothetical protein
LGGDARLGDMVDLSWEGKPRPTADIVRVRTWGGLTASNDGLSNAPAILGRRASPLDGRVDGVLLPDRSTSEDGIADALRMCADDLLSFPTASASAFPRWFSEYRNDGRLFWAWAIPLTGGGPASFLFRGDGCIVDVDVEVEVPAGILTRVGALV